MNEKVAVVAPPTTVTVAGTVPAAVFPEVRLTMNPPVGAGLESVTVPVERFPPMTELGLNASPVTVGALSVRAAEAVPFAVAETFAVPSTPTAVVVTVNVAVVAPAATVTDEGTVADALSDRRATEVPPVGAGPVRVTVPVEGLPPTTDVGLSDTDVTPAVVTASDALAVEVSAPVALM